MNKASSSMTIQSLPKSVHSESSWWRRPVETLVVSIPTSRC